MWIQTCNSEPIFNCKLQLCGLDRAQVIHEYHVCNDFFQYLYGAVIYMYIIILMYLSNTILGGGGIFALRYSCTFVVSI